MLASPCASPSPRASHIDMLASPTPTRFPTDDILRTPGSLAHRARIAPADHGDDAPNAEMRCAVDASSMDPATLNDKSSLLTCFFDILWKNWMRGNLNWFLCGQYNVQYGTFPSDHHWFAFDVIRSGYRESSTAKCGYDNLWGPRPTPALRVSNIGDL